MKNLHTLLQDGTLNDLYLLRIVDELFSTHFPILEMEVMLAKLLQKFIKFDISRPDVYTIKGKLNGKFSEIQNRDFVTNYLMKLLNLNMLIQVSWIVVFILKTIFNLFCNLWKMKWQCHVFSCSKIFKSKFGKIYRKIWPVFISRVR